MEMKITLPEKEMPTRWYNALPDLPTPLAPPLDPQTHKPLTPTNPTPPSPRSTTPRSKG